MLKKKLFKFFLTSLISCVSLQASSTKVQESQTVVIIGGGVAGLSAAIFAARSGCNPIVIAGKNPGGALAQSPSVQNWPGDYDISGYSLITKMQDQAIKNGAKILDEQVIFVDFSKKPYLVVTQDINDPTKTSSLKADVCIVSTGSEPKRLGLDSEETFWGKGVYSCAICDGPLYKNKTVAVVGGGDSALLEAEYLSKIANKVYVLVRGSKLKANELKRAETLFATPNVEFLFDTTINEIISSDLGLSELKIKKGSKDHSLSVNALFLAIGSTPNTQLFAGKLRLNDSGFIIRDKDLKTSVDGVYAVGDVSDQNLKQAVVASAEGATAALNALNYLFMNQNLTVPKKNLSSISDANSSKNFKAIESNIANADTNKIPAKVIEIKNLEEFNMYLLESDVPVLVDFYASWCKPCRYMTPKLETYAEQLGGKYQIFKVNVHDVTALADYFNIRSMPTLIKVSKEGKEQERKMGVREIISFLDSLK